jgi:FKBP-type peptidyl-prolyl cis-trans isomerase
MKKFVIAALALMVLGCSTDNVLSDADQLKKDVATIDKYLEKNGIDAVKDPSGLRLVIQEVGAGLKPTSSSKLTVKYVGRFLNGTEFDRSKLTSSGSPEPFASPLSDLIVGWQYAFTYIGKGGKATLYIPSTLGYGHAGRAPGIPGNSNLVFDIELIGFTN